MPDVVPSSYEERREQAERLTVRVLDFVSRDGERLRRFLRSTKLTAEQLRQAARLPLFHTSVLDHVLRDTTTLHALEIHEQIDEAMIRAAQKALEPPKREREAASRRRPDKINGPELPRRPLYI